LVRRTASFAVGSVTIVLGKDDMMKSTALLALAASLLSSADGLALQKREDGPPRVLSLPIHRGTVTNPVVRDRLRRRGTLAGTLDNLVSRRRSRS
jgi:hypothetical protein